MAPPKKSGGANPPPDGEDFFIPPDQEFQSALDELSATDAEGSINVYREGPGGYRDVTFIRSFGLAEFSKELLQGPPFNGGKFRLHLISRGNQFVRNIAFRCEPNDAAREALKAPTPVQIPAQTDTAAMLTAIQAGFRDMAQAMMGIAQARPQGMDFEQTIRLFGLLQQSARPTGPEQNPMSLLKELLTLQKEIAPLPIGKDGDVGENALLLSVIERVGAPLMDLLLRAQGQAPQPAQALPPPPAPPAPALSKQAPVAPNPAPDVMPEETDMQMKTRLLKPVILLAAKVDAPTDSYAGLLLDHFSDEEIAQYVQSADWFEQLCGLMPELQPYREWVSRVRDDLLGLLTPELEASITEGNNPSESPGAS